MRSRQFPADAKEFTLGNRSLSWQTCTCLVVWATPAQSGHMSLFVLAVERKVSPVTLVQKSRVEQLVPPNQDYKEDSFQRWTL